MGDLHEGGQPEGHPAARCPVLHLMEALHQLASHRILQGAELLWLTFEDLHTMRDTLTSCNLPQPCTAFGHRHPPPPRATNSEGRIWNPEITAACADCGKRSIAGGSLGPYPSLPPVGNYGRQARQQVQIAGGQSCEIPRQSWWSAHIKMML
jgi:hypothetical protein